MKDNWSWHMCMSLKSRNNAFWAETFVSESFHWQLFFISRDQNTFKLKPLFMCLVTSTASTRISDYGTSAPWRTFIFLTESKSNSWFFCSSLKYSSTPYVPKIRRWEQPALSFPGVIPRHSCKNGCYSEVLLLLSTDLPDSLSHLLVHNIPSYLNPATLLDVTVPMDDLVNTLASEILYSTPLPPASTSLSHPGLCHLSNLPLWLQPPLTLV